MARSVALIGDRRTDVRVNRLLAMTRYAAAMGWTAHVCEASQLDEMLASQSVDLVLCWRLDDVRDLATVYARCISGGIEILPIAQSCSALAE